MLECRLSLELELSNAVVLETIGRKEVDLSVGWPLLILLRPASDRLDWLTS